MPGIISKLKLLTPSQIFAATIGLIVISSSLTFLSLRYQQPPNCKSYCWQSPCKIGQCYGVKAGFPFPFIFDDSGGSPVDGWGKIGREDFFNHPDFLAIFLNILFYSLLLIVVFKMIMFVKKRFLN
jgi:hypothetical protein